MNGKYLKLVLILAVALGGSAAAGAELGDAAGPLKIDKWVKGQPVELKAGKGKTVYVVEFWATWCPPCRASIPHLTKLQEKYKSKGVTFVGVSTEQVSTVEAYVKKQGDKMNYTVAVDKNGGTSKAYMDAFGVGGIPHAFIVDKEGRIVWHGHPMGDLERQLERTLGGRLDPEKLKKAAKARQQMALVGGQYLKLAQSKDEVRKDAARKDAARKDAREKELAALGETFAAHPAQDATLLKRFAWILLTEKKLVKRDLALALRCAQAADKASKGEDADIIDTLARAHFENGDVKKALELERKALKLAEEEHLKEYFKKELARYEAALEK